MSSKLTKHNRIKKIGHQIHRKHDVTPNNLSLDLADWWNRNNHKNDTSSRGVTTFFANSVYIYIYCAMIQKFSTLHFKVTDNEVIVLFWTFRMERYIRFLAEITTGLGHQLLWMGMDWSWGGGKLSVWFGALCIISLSTITRAKVWSLSIRNMMFNSYWIGLVLGFESFLWQLLMNIISL